MCAEVLSSLTKRNGGEGGDWPAVSGCFGALAPLRVCTVAVTTRAEPVKNLKDSCQVCCFFGFTGPVVYFEGGVLCTGEVKGR